MGDVFIVYYIVESYFNSWGHPGDILGTYPSFYIPLYTNLKIKNAYIMVFNIMWTT